MISWDYVSAFIDGEGTVSNPYNKTSYKPKAFITIGNNDLHILQMIQDKLKDDLNMSSSIYLKKTYNNYPQQYTFAVFGEEKLWILNNYLDLQIEHKRINLSYWVNKYFEKENRKLISTYSNISAYHLSPLVGYSINAICNWRKGKYVKNKT